MAKIYLVASGKGGVGKTTVCANLGIIYALAGYNVILIDADIGLNNLDVVLNVEDKIVYDIVDVIENRVKISQALVEVDGVKNLRLLSSGRVKVSERITGAMFSNVVNEIAQIADIILIDAPAGIENGFHRAASASQEAIIVTTPHVSAIKDADRAIGILSTYHLKGIGLVVNRFRNDLYLKGEILDSISIAELLKIPLYGTIPESDRIGIYSTILGGYKDKSFKAYKDIQQKLVSGEVLGINTKKQKIWWRLGK